VSGVKEKKKKSQRQEKTVLREEHSWPRKKSKRTALACSTPSLRQYSSSKALLSIFQPVRK